MIKYFERLNLNLNAEKEEKLSTFKDLLYKNNEKFNLTSIKEESEFYIKYIYDSIIGEKFFKENSSVMEIGSGGGFPSVPLMIVRPDLKFTLLEATGKKCEYLKEVIKELNLNGEVICGRAEELGKDKNLREKFDHVTARAVARLNVLNEYTLPFLKIGGTAVLYKSKDDEELKEAKKSIIELGGKLNETFNYSLLNDMGSRSVYIIEKIKNTPILYPRENNKIKKSPIK